MVLRQPKINSGDTKMTNELEKLIASMTDEQLEMAFSDFIGLTIEGDK